MTLWKPVPSAPWLEASSGGEIRRVYRNRRNHAIRPLKPYINHGGYLWIKARDRAGLAHMGVHRMVCEAFHGLAPSAEHETAHNNGVRQDNRPENLRWATSAENAADRIAHGNSGKGQLHPGAKLSADAVLFIFMARASGRCAGNIAAALGVSKHHVNKILAGTAWSHFEPSKAFA